jgi:CO/xanthine dehydrogenase FAD-binding subunit
VEVLTPRTLDEALALKAERKDAVPIQGGTDVMVELNFDRSRPETILNLNEVAELRGWGRDNGTLRLGSGLTYARRWKTGSHRCCRLWQRRSRTVGSPQIRNRGTLGGNLGTASPAGDALPPCSSTRRKWWSRRPREECAWFRSRASSQDRSKTRFLPDELIVAVRLNLARCARPS